MLLEEFDRLCASRNLTPVGSRYYGVHNDYPFSVSVNRKAAGIVTFSFRLDASLENNALKSLRAEMPKGYAILAAGGNTYQLNCIGSRLKQSEVSLTQMLDTFCRGLRNSGIVPSDRCPVCQQSGCDAYADIGGYTAAHRRCVEGLAENASTKAKSDLKSGSYVTGLIGAFLGGLVACIPSIAIYFAGWMVGYLYALIPLGAYYGYKLFRGRMNNAAFICTCIVSVFHLFSMEQVIFYIAVHNELDIWPSIIETVRLYWSIATPSMIVQDMYMSAIFMVLGLWISWSSIRRNAFTDLHSVVAVRSTLTDKPGAIPTAAAAQTYIPDELDRPLV